MSYIILPDFKTLIQSDNLSGIIGGDYTIIDQCNNAAQTEVTSYLKQKYETDEEFTNTQIWSRTPAYKAKDRVYLDADNYSVTSAYAVNNLVNYSGNVYFCNTIIASPGEAWTLSHWTLIGARYSIYFVTLPNPEFDYAGTYKKGDVIFWRDKTYTCLIDTAFLSHAAEIQYSTYKALPPINIAPDDQTAGLKYWGSGTAYSVAAATLPTDTTKFTAGDNRNPQLVNIVIDVSLYIMHSRIAPRNIPDLRVKRYDDAIKWLKNVATGQNITAALPLIKPSQGSRIRWGSDVKKINQY